MPLAEKDREIIAKAFKEALNEDNTKNKLNIIILTQVVIATLAAFCIFSLFFLAA